MANIFSVKGRLKRKGYFNTFIGVSIFWVAVSYLLMNWLPPAKGEAFFISRFLLDILALLSVTPIMLRRAHDISLPSYVLIIFWLAIPFSVRNIVYLKQYFKIEVDLTHWLIIALYLAGLFLMLMLFLYKSYSKDNKWGKI